MFTGPVMLVPGQELRIFEVGRPVTRATDGGRAGVAGGYEPVGEIPGVLAQARPDEAERWRQSIHPVTHKVIMQRAPAFDVMPGDVLTCAGRRLYVQALPYDIGGLGLWTIFYCSERPDAA